MSCVCVLLNFCCVFWFWFLSFGIALMCDGHLDLGFLNPSVPSSSNICPYTTILLYMSVIKSEVKLLGACFCIYPALNFITVFCFFFVIQISVFQYTGCISKCNFIPHIYKYFKMYNDLYISLFSNCMFLVSAKPFSALLCISGSFESKAFFIPLLILFVTPPFPSSLPPSPF